MQNRNDLDINKLESKKDRGDINKRIKHTNSLPKKDGRATFIKDRGDLLTINDKTINKSNEVSEDSKNVKAEDLKKQFKRFIRSDIKNKNDGGLNIPKLDLTRKMDNPNNGFRSKNFEKSNSFDTALKNTNQNETKRNNFKNPANLDVLTDKSDVKSVKHEAIPKSTRLNEVTNKSFAKNVHVVKKNIMGSENTISGDKEVDTRQKRPVISTIVTKKDALKVFKAVTFAEEKKKTNMLLQIKIPVPMNHNLDEDLTKQNTNNQNILQDTEKNKKPKTLPYNMDKFNINDKAAKSKVKNDIPSKNRKEPNLRKKNDPKAPQINDNVFKVSHNTEVINSTRNGKDSKALQIESDVKNLNNKRNGDVNLRNKKDPNFLRVEDALNNSRNMKDLNVSQKDCDAKKIKKDPIQKCTVISTDTKASKRSQRDVINLARNRREPKVSQSNDIESKTSASGKSRVSKNKSKRLKKHPSPMTLFTDNGSPITEVAKWAPNCVDNHTRRYYEAWVDTTLAAVARDTGTHQDLVRAIRRAVERAPPSPELIHENYLDERYTGRIKINHRQ